MMILLVSQGPFFFSTWESVTAFFSATNNNAARLLHARFPAAEKPKKAQARKKRNVGRYSVLVASMHVRFLRSTVLGPVGPVLF